MRGKKERRREKKVWQFVSVIYELNFAKITKERNQFFFFSFLFWE